jgi:Rrf2 family protein
VLPVFALNKKTGYGLIALIHLARLGEGELISAREIAERSGAPQALLMNALKDLAGGGLVESVLGARGGYRLGRPPEGIHLEAVIAVLEGPVVLAECAEPASDGDGSAHCPVHGRCPVTPSVRKLQAGLREFLRGVTLADVVAWSSQPAAT